MPELTITSSYVHSRVDSNTLTMGNPVLGSTVNSMLESTLSLSQGLRIWPQVTMQEMSNEADPEGWMEQSVRVQICSIPSLRESLAEVE
jgi:hypothetical protein